MNENDYITPRKKWFGYLIGKSKRSSLFLILVVPFVILIVTIIGLISYLSYRSSQNVVSDLANKLMAEIAIRIDQNLSNYMRDIEKITQSNAALVQAGLLDPGNQASLRRHFWEQLHNYELASTVALGTEKRDFMALEKDNISFILREYDKRTKLYASYRLNENAEKTIQTGVIKDYDPLNDPPHDPWYAKTKARKSSSWLLVVSMAKGPNEPELMIVNFLPVFDKRNNMLGVAASSIYLSQLGRYLMSLRIGQHGQAYVVDRQGNLIATSTGEMPFRQKGGATYPETMITDKMRIKAVESENPVTSASINSIISVYGRLDGFLEAQRTVFRLEGTRYFMHINPIKKGDLDLLTVIVVPETDFMAFINQSARDNLFLSLFALSVAVIVGIFAVRWVTAPIMHLNKAAREIAEGDMDRTVTIARSDEIGELANTFNRMAAKLKSSFDLLQQENAERRQTEEALRLTQFSVDRASFNILWLDEEANLIYVNDNACSSLGYTREELLTMKIHAIDPDFTPGMWPPHFQELRTRGAITFESRHRTKDGRFFPAEITCTYFEYNGRAYSFSFDRDITERKQAEESLQESEKRFRMLIQDVPAIAIQGYRLDGTTTYWNKASEILYGYSAEEAIGRNLLDLIIPPETQTEVRESMQKMIGTGQPIPSAELSLVRKDGSRVAVFSNHALVRLPDSSTELFCLDIDLTDRRKAEEELRRLSIAIEQAAESVIITDPEGTIQYVNPAFERITGYSRVEAIGRNPVILKSGLHEPAFYADLWNAIKSGNVWTGRITNQRKDGKLIHEDATISPLITSAGKLTGYVALKRDVTESVRLESQLRQAQKMEAIGTLAGGIAHDFNNILGAMMGFAELAKFKTTDVKISPYLEHILKACERSRDLVKQILTFSRQTEQEKKPVMLIPIIKEVIKFIRASLPTTIEIKHSLNADSDLIMADATQIHQLLMNLCTNAGHAMKEKGGTLDIALDEVSIGPEDAPLPSLMRGRYLQLTVRDTGHGMNEELLERIFEPYFTTKGQGDGTGLGLSVVDGIVKSHDGTIKVYSEVGKGSAFHVYLPLVEEQAETDGSEDVKSLPRGNERVLFVDDEEALVQVGKISLEDLGYRVVTETDPVRAIALFNEDKYSFDLVITDKTMPHITGFDLAREIRNIRGDIPIIICSGYQDKDDLKKLSDLGISYFISKPIQTTLMAETVRYVLDKKK